MDRAHGKVVEAQFGPRAKAYVESAVHAQGADLDALEAIVREMRPPRALDLGTGGGHVSYLMARHAGAVTASDLSRDMLDAVAAAARERGLSNIETVQAPAEHLPFDDGRFDFLACRFSAHHWRDFQGGLGEARRVLKDGARAVFIDVHSAGPALFDTHLQAVELLRDTSHVRDYTASEWTRCARPCRVRAGRLPDVAAAHGLSRLDGRMRTPDENIRAIRALQAAASSETRAHFAIEPDGSFLLDILMLETTAG